MPGRRLDLATFIRMDLSVTCVRQAKRCLRTQPLPRQPSASIEGHPMDPITYPGCS